MTKRKKSKLMKCADTFFEVILKNLPNPHAPVELIYANAYVRVLRDLVELAISHLDISVELPTTARTLREWVAWDRLAHVLEELRVIELARSEAWDWVEDYYENVGLSYEVDDAVRERANRIVNMLNNE